MQVRGDMVDAEGPMGPDQKTWGGWWSVLLTLGSEHPRVRVSFKNTVSYMKAHWNKIMMVFMKSVICLCKHASMHLCTLHSLI